MTLNRQIIQIYDKIAIGNNFLFQFGIRYFELLYFVMIKAAVFIMAVFIIIQKFSRFYSYSN